MTEEERIELLQEVARVAPKEMGAELVQFPIEYECDGVEDIDWDVRCVKFTECERTTFDGRLGNQSPKLYLDGSIDDAAPCFAMLDAMEKDGASYSLYRVSGGQYYCDSTCSARVQAKGSTRAEAIARAFVAVFGDK